MSFEKDRRVSVDCESVLTHPKTLGLQHLVVTTFVSYGHGTSPLVGLFVKRVLTLLFAAFDLIVSGMVGGVGDEYS